MVRTLRRACPSCGKPGFYIEGRRRTSCFYCGKPILQPPTRRQVLVDFRCPACEVVSEVEDTASIVRCPGCRRGFAWVHDEPVPRWCVRDVVSRDRAVRLAEKRGLGKIEEATLFLAPYWLFRAVELGWVLGNEKLTDVGPRKRRGVDPARDDPGRESVAPIGGKLEYTKKEAHRAVQEYLADPSAEAFGWKPVAKHAEGAVLAPFDVAEIEPRARVLATAWDRAQALDEGARRIQLRALVDEGQLYRFFEHRVLLRETLAIVYHPFWVLFFEPPDVPGRESIPRDWMVVDAVAGEVTREPQAGGPALFRIPTTALPETPSRTERLGCPACHDPLDAVEPAAGATVIACPGCSAAFEVSARGLRPVESRFVEPVEGAAEETGEQVYVPVWRYRVRIKSERRELKNRGHWKRFIRAVDPSPDPNDVARSIVFYSVAAGAARTARLDALSLALTRLQPELRFVAPRPPARVLPAAFGADDARRLGFATYLTLFRDLTLKSIDGLKRTELVTQEAELIYYPCVRNRGEVQDPRLGVSIQLGPAHDS